MKRWAVGITVLYVSFVVAVIIMVVYMNNADFDLVDENYYEKEIKYQQHIDKVKRTSDNNMDIHISYKDNKLYLNFSEGLRYSDCTGEIFFYYPAFKKDDFKIQINVNNLGKQVIDVSERVAKGNWIIKIDWKYKNKSYYSEETIYID